MARPRLPSLSFSACARGAIERCQPADPPVRLTRASGGAAAAGRRRRAGFLFRDFHFRMSGAGPTMELGRSAALVRWRTLLRSTALRFDGAVSVLAWSGRRQVRWVASAASYGVIDNRGQILQHCHCYACLARSTLRLRKLSGICPRSPAMSFSRVRARRHRAVPAGRPAGAPMRPSPPGRRCGCWPTSTRRILFRAFHFSDVRSGANDGARAVSGAGEVANAAAVDGAEVRRRRVGAGLVGAAAGEVGGERRELRGHRQSRANSPALSLYRVHQLCLSHACARGAIERCQPTDPPVRLTRSSRRRGCWPTSTRRILFRRFLFRKSGSGSGPTIELERMELGGQRRW